MDKYVSLSLVTIVSAVIIGCGGLLEIWSIATNPLILIIELLTLVLLLINSMLILRWVYDFSIHPLYRKLACLCLASLVFCILGDLVNFNFFQTYFKYGQNIKHDYLIDSIFFFAPGYLLLLIAILLLIHERHPIRPFQIVSALVIALVIAISSLSLMIPADTEIFFILIPFAYSVLICLVGVSGIWLMQVYGGWRAPMSVWGITIGLILATFGDALIGEYWLYGNGGEGFFPFARNLNWIVYITSQSFVIHLPKVAVEYRIGISITKVFR